MQIMARLTGRKFPALEILAEKVQINIFFKVYLKDCPKRSSQTSLVSAKEVMQA